MTATATFKNPEQAREFARAWAKETDKGMMISTANEKGEVTATAYSIDEYGREWISAYVKELNK